MAGVITRERRSTGIALIVLEAEIACELAMLSASQARYDYFEAKLGTTPRASRNSACYDHRSLGETSWPG